MFDFVYYPVSAVLWLWHTAFAAVLGPASGLAWVLAVVFLVASLRAVLLFPFVKQARTQAVLQRLQPQLRAIQQKYPEDKQQQYLETRKLRKDHGVSMLAGCLPALGQGLVFFGLFHVLRSFDRTGTAGHLPFGSTPAPMTVEQNAATANYFFDAAEVRSFLQAELFGAPLSGTPAGHPTVAMGAVVVTLMLIAAVATHFTARASIARQDPAAQQIPMMNTLMLWVFPAGVLVGGALLPVAILLYWVSNNAWTLAQQHFVYRRLDAESAAATTEVVVRKATAPKPGVKPRRR
ncbi:membrane protein insertase YidC [Nocardia goodfellowii]|uniref:Membrane protein insertase YidC n=1 Tax=Nocardia goodfellowii TaxID=882446 RepID=A0ABS4QHC9_9NOCA|nr:membrane protein insertase YidC [Nocardia goodfellowii]MBP2190993.1 YidC/Oxa1 family membrane protein insertase [Nocardia goodfellowii]